MASPTASSVGVRRFRLGGLPRHRALHTRWGHRFTDSSAALAVSQRGGCGKLRHVRIGHLWVQERVAMRELTVSKVLGTENPADIFTKVLVPAKLHPLMDKLGQVFADGEACTRVHLC